jgi:hypothetical protein
MPSTKAPPNTFIILKLEVSNEDGLKGTYPNRPVTFMSLALVIASILVPIFQVTTRLTSLVIIGPTTIIIMPLLNRKKIIFKYVILT